MNARHNAVERSSPSSAATLRRLAWFRYEIRRFLRFSETAARASGLTPMQHQLLLGVAGFTGRGWATITELAEFLQLRHNAAVGLVQRGVRSGLVRKVSGRGDRRFVRVHLTARGEKLLTGLSRRHLAEIRRIQMHLSTVHTVRPRLVRNDAA